MKLLLICTLCILILCTCSKDDDPPSSKANFDFTAAEASKNENLFTYYGNTVYEASTNAIILTTANQGMSGGAFYKFRQDISVGFEIEFDFSITKQGGIYDCENYQGGDGLALLLIAGSNVTVSGGGGLGYSGTPNSIAFEIDTWCNSNLNDPNGNHISIHTGYNNGNDVNENYSLGAADQLPNMSNGSTHTLKVYYRDKTITLYLDGTTVLYSKAGQFDIDKILTMQNNLVYVGLTASTGSAYERHNIHRFKLKML